MNNSVKTIQKTLRSLLAGASLVFLGFVLAVTVIPNTNTFATPDRAMPSPIGSDLLTETERVFSEIYNRVAPAVVSITTATQVSDDNFSNTSTGSGFVIDTQGHIVTNFHVVDDAERIEIRMFDGTITRAEVVGLDPDSDIAIIKVDVSADRLFPVPLADSDALNVGETVLAIGNPFSNNWTLTSGIISALDRRIIGLNNYSIGGVIQTDAAINPGNSGGPLLNLDGEVIGVNSQIESGLRQNAGIGFAVPSNLVERVSAELIRNGQVSYSYIGINSRPIDLDLIEQFNLPDNIRGVAVWQALTGFPAASAGLRTIGVDSIDIITAIDSNPVRNFDQMVGYLAINTVPGQTINLTVYRGGQVLNLPVTLSERPTR